MAILSFPSVRIISESLFYKRPVINLPKNSELIELCHEAVELFDSIPISLLKSVGLNSSANKLLLEFLYKLDNVAAEIDFCGTNLEKKKLSFLLLGLFLRLKITSEEQYTKALQSLSSVNNFIAFESNIKSFNSF